MFDNFMNRHIGVANQEDLSQMLQVIGPIAGSVHFCYEGPALNISSELSITCDEVSLLLTFQS